MAHLHIVMRKCNLTHVCNRSRRQTHIGLSTGNLRDKKHHIHHNTCKGAINIEHIQTYSKWQWCSNVVGSRWILITPGCNINDEKKCCSINDSLQWCNKKVSRNFSSKSEVENWSIKIESNGHENRTDMWYGANIWKTVTAVSEHGNTEPASIVQAYIWVPSLESWEWWVKESFYHWWTLPTHPMPYDSMYTLYRYYTHSHIQWQSQ